MADKPIDELAERRATKGIFRIRIGAGSKEIARDAEVPLSAMPDPFATLRARARRKKK